MRKKIILDTDPGIDDATALLFAARHPDIEILGITTVFGNADIDTVTRNARYLKQLFCIDAPVAQGAGRARLALPNPPPAHVHGVNGLGDVEIADMALPALDPRPAHVLFSDLTRQYPGEVTIVALGHLTNLSLALTHDPGIATRTEHVVIMGGAFDVAGNVNPVAEANILGDPHAADRVFGANWHLTAIGLDVTQKVILREAEMARLAKTGGPEMAFIARITEPYFRFHDRYGIGGCYVHDATAAAFVIAPELFTLRGGAVRVATEGLATGLTIQRNADIPYGPNAWDMSPMQDVAVDVDAEGVLGLLAKTLGSAEG